MRLVPDQAPREIARKATAYLKKIAPKSIKVSVRDLHGGDAWVAPTDHPALVCAGSAMRRAFGKQPVFVREGGSIPIISDFEHQLKVPAVLMGVGLNDDQIHAPNEKLDLVNFYRGIEASAYLMEELGRQAAPAAAPGKKPGRAKAGKTRRAGSKRR
jgi:acetylornithine deacetylase/succinyl-diaminopimelate desuccinylase-like protein